MPKILVTGETGFVGRNLTKRLIEKGNLVRCLARKTSNVNSIRYLTSLGAEIHYGNILDKDSLKIAVRQIDIIYHFAAEVYPKKSSRYYSVNVNGTKNLLRCCIGQNIKKFVFLSSAAVYSPTKNKKSVLTEDIECKPITIYGRSKLIAERFIQDFATKNKINFTIIRAPVIYGPGLYDFSITSIIVHLIDKRRFKLIGRGRNLISLCNIDNLIEAMILSMEKDSANDEIFNIADEKLLKLKEIVKTISEELRVPISKTYIPTWIAYIFISLILPFKEFLKLPIQISYSSIKEISRNWILDISKARKKLGYMPKVSFKEGIKSLIAWYKSNNILEREK